MDHGLREHVKDYWGDRAATYDDEPDHGLVHPEVRAAWMARLVAWLPGDGLDVVEPGCGTGSLSLLLAAAGHRVRGFDLTPEMVERARSKATAAGLDAQFEVADAATLPLPPASVDAVLVRHLVWTLPDPHAALAGWVELLRPGGRLVLVEGRWGTAAQEPGDASPDPRLPWGGGARAATLVEALQPLVRNLEVHDLSVDDLLWGRPVDDERYAVTAVVA